MVQIICVIVFYLHAPIDLEILNRGKCLHICSPGKENKSHRTVKTLKEEIEFHT